MPSPSATKNGLLSPASASAKKGAKSFKEDKLLNGKSKPASGARPSLGKSAPGGAHGTRGAFASDSPA